MIEVEIRPRVQFRELLTSTCRWAVIVAHRRAGKTVACIQKLIKEALECSKARPRFAYIAPLLKQAKTVAWDYLKAYALGIPGTSANESELRIDFPNGAQIRLFGTDNPDSLRGIYLDGVVLDEAADMSPRLFDEIIRPALADRKGWAVWIGTPKGQNAFFDLWVDSENKPGWLRLMLKASETGLVDEDELRDAQQSMTFEQYRQEFECSFMAAIMGAYYGREMEAARNEGRIVPRLYDKHLPVSTAWDLGAGDDTVIWFFQKSGMDLRVVDLYANNGYGLDHYADILHGKPYRFDKHLLPFDVEQRVLSGGEIARTRRETLESLGVPVTVVAKWPVEEGINAVRRILPRMWFDSETCHEGIRAIEQYRRKYDEVRKVFQERPLHDWTSHYADALRMLAVGVDEPRAKSGTRRKGEVKLKWVV